MTSGTLLTTARIQTQVHVHHVLYGTVPHRYQVPVATTINENNINS